MQREQLKPNAILKGPIFPEPVQVIVTIPLGDAVKVIAEGLRTGQVHKPVLSAEQLARLEASPEKEPFDGEPTVSGCRRRSPDTASLLLRHRKGYTLRPRGRPRRRGLPTFRPDGAALVYTGSDCVMSDSEEVTDALLTLLPETRPGRSAVESLRQDRPGATKPARVSLEHQPEPRPPGAPAGATLAGMNRGPHCSPSLVSAGRGARSSHPRRSPPLGRKPNGPPSRLRTVPGDPGGQRCWNRR